jgi:3-(methylthio)propionyl---CoA ligase
MQALMMAGPLLIPNIIEYAARYYPHREVVSRNLDGSLHRYGYGEAAGRVRKLANALMKLGLQPGDRLGTLAWNHYRHLELYYAVPGAGYVCHTINPRLFPEQIAYIINHADDRYIFVDPCFAPLIEGLAPHLSKVKAFIYLGTRSEMPPSQLANLICYEDLIADEPGVFNWPQLDENTASGLCYTSGTTGNPKGVLYSHRSTVLHAMGINLPGTFGFTPDECVLPVVPMFHVNAWCVPYAAPMVGAKLAFPGPRLDGASLQQLIDVESITIAAGVPTVWMNLLNHVEANGLGLSPLKRVVIGGSAPSQDMLEGFGKYGALAINAWGMTETSPFGSASVLTREHEALDEHEKMRMRLKTGRAPFGVDMRITGADGAPLAWDGVTRGELEVRGPWIASAYFGIDDRAAFTGDGWFRTGDISTIDAHGFMQIVDRVKDVIKSGGEWISSIELENLAQAHPCVREAAVIARACSRWTERPRFILALHSGKPITGASLREVIEPYVAKWWIPEDYIVVDELPHTATGKLLKMELRRLYGAEHHEMALPL